MSSKPIQRSINRNNISPFLLRTFIKEGSHHAVEDFHANKVPDNEVEIHIWKDSTYGEVADMLRVDLDLNKRRDIKLSFSSVYPKKTGSYGFSESIIVIPGRKTVDSDRYISSDGFEIGDYMDVAILSK